MSASKTRVIGVAAVLVLAGIGFGAYRLTATAKDTAKPTTAAVTLDATKLEQTKTDKPGPLWGKQCQTGSDGKQTCFVIQNVVITDKSTNNSLRALLVAVGYAPGDTALRMELTVPLGIDLASGIGFQIDNGQASSVSAETCVADGCHVVMKIDQGGRDSLVKGKLVRVTYQFTNGQRVTLPIELAGFGDALAQLRPAP